MLVGIDTYRSLIETFLMPTIEKIFNDHFYTIGGFGICADEGVGEVVLTLSDIPVHINLYYCDAMGIESRDYSKYDIIHNEVIDTLTKMGFDKENLSFGYNTIIFKNFEFHKKLLNKNLSKM